MTTAAAATPHRPWEFPRRDDLELSAHAREHADYLAEAQGRTPGEVIEGALALELRAAHEGAVTVSLGYGELGLPALLAAARELGIAHEELARRALQLGLHALTRGA